MDVEGRTKTHDEAIRSENVDMSNEKNGRTRVFFRKDLGRIHSAENPKVPIQTESELGKERGRGGDVGRLSRLSMGGGSPTRRSLMDS